MDRIAKPIHLKIHRILLDRLKIRTKSSGRQRLRQEAAWIVESMVCAAQKLDDRGCRFWDDPMARISWAGKG